jgi:tetratricopeptide (TPR) repeat protein
MKRSFSTGTARRTWLRQHRHELQMTALLLVMVVLPSAVLGTFAWRAIQSEKLAWRERERQTYQEIAKLAAHGIDQQLRDIERDWSATLDSLTQAARSRRGLAARAAAFTSGHALVDGGYVLSVSGGVLYPPALHGESAPTWDAPDADEREQFDALMNDGEQFEYVSHRYDRAIAAYREARRHVHSDELRSMFETAIGRAQLKAGDREGAIVTYRQVLQRYPEVRDLDRMVVRFLAQYQIAAALGELGRDHEAMDTLLALHRDLLARSDDITALQYAYYADLIRGLSARLLSTPGLKGGGGVRGRVPAPRRAHEERAQPQVPRPRADGRAGGVGGPPTALVRPAPLRLGSQRQRPVPARLSRAARPGGRERHRPRRGAGRPGRPAKGDHPLAARPSRRRPRGGAGGGRGRRGLRARDGVACARDAGDADARRSVRLLARRPGAA